MNAFQSEGNGEKSKGCWDDWEWVVICKGCRDSGVGVQMIHTQTYKPGLVALIFFILSLNFVSGTPKK